MPTAVDRAVRALRGGGLIVYPTDTLYGLGASAVNPEAVRRLTDAKARPDGMPISVAVSSHEEVEPWVDWGPGARALARRVLPGPYTLLVPSSRAGRRELAPGILGPDGSLGVRIPAHPVARTLARRVGPITCTSANRHGLPPGPRLRDARAQLGSRVDVYLDMRPPPSGRPSTVIDLRGDAVRIIPRT
jgi:L-threonylcarbamoyladenylate synthase